MAQYRDLNAPPGRVLADIVADMKAEARQSKTGAAGVKDLGLLGDIVWTRPSSSAASLRDVDLDLADARQRIEDAERDLSGTGQRLADAEQAVTDAVAAIDGKLDEAALDDDATSRRLATAMEDVTRKLIVTESAILNHATLIGDTVVDNINVQGKLIGTDGVFTGTVDFANVNVTGTQIVNKLAANSISADKISGGSFEGNQFTGGTFEGTAFRGGSFVGGIYATHPNPDQVGGVMIDDNWGIRGWDSDGNRVFWLSRNTGTLRQSATTYLTDPATGDGLVLAPRSVEGSSYIYFSAGGTTAGSQAAIWRQSYSNGDEPLMMRGAQGGGVHVQDILSVAGPISGKQDLLLTRDARVVRHIQARGNLLAAGAATTSAASNAYIVSPSHSSWTEAGRVYVGKSSRRYKRNIVDWNPDAERVLAMRPRQWQHSDPASPIDERWHVGFIAEEIDDLGLRGLVRYEVSPKGDYLPDGLNYERFAAAQQIVLQKHEAEINELRERIALLEKNQEHQ